jgi:hypothetical protein
MNPQPILHALMESHGLQVRAHGGWLVADGRPAVTRATLHREPDWHPHLVQLDMEIITPDGRRLIESVTGIGADGPDAAVKNGMLTLAMSSLDVLLRTFWDAQCPELDAEQWQTAAGPRQALMSSLNLRGGIKADALPDLYAMVRPAVAERITKDLHWLRIFRCCGPTPHTEVLFDNEDWADLRTAIDALPWPQTAQYSSVRWFLTVSDPAAMKGATPADR